MKTLILLFSILLVVCADSVELDYDSDYDDYSDEEENYCEIPKLVNEYWDYYLKNDPITDTMEGTFLNVPKGNVTEIQTNEKYITAVIENDEILFQTTARFKDFEYVTRNQKSNPDFSQNFKIICNQSTLEFSFEQPVIDTNNHEPFFNREVYTYQFGMEINSGFTLTNLLSIIVTDIDITDTDLKLSFVEDEGSELMKVETSRSENLDKSHFLKLTTLKKLPLPFDKKFKIRAADKEGKFGEATIHLITSKAGSD